MHDGPRSVARCVAVGALLALAGFAAEAGAQVSPGPLATPHRDLDSPTQCFKCHARGGGMTPRCLDCHTRIASLRDAGRGLHGRQAKSLECAGCHPDHAGREFALIRWDEGAPEKFDHARAGWALDGKHVGVACADCHREKFQRGAPSSDPSHRWVGLETACRSCHDDPHASRFGTDCERCHTTKDWKAIDSKRFDHDVTRYPLKGAHARVRCESCHVPGTTTAKQPPFERCGSCHADAHAGQGTLAGKAADCAACHDVNAFRPSTYTVARHRSSAYPLEGRHAVIACATCHPKAPPGAATSAATGTSGVRMRPPHARCTSCHEDAHGGQLAGRPDRGACESCHRVQGFRPSTYPISSHAAAGFPLAGRHAEIACGACHAVSRSGLGAMANARGAGTARFVFHPPERECAQCHHDPHQGRFSPGGARPRPEGCVACHDVAAFRPGRIDVSAHRSFGFVLEGAHGAVPCAGCHAELSSKPAASSLVAAASHPKPMTFPGSRSACAACHETPHGTQFASRPGKGACEPCHDADSFRPARRFDHDRDATFRLEGAHAKVACIRCHPRTADAKGVSRVKYRGIPSRCEACHGDAGTGDTTRSRPASPGRRSPATRGSR